MAALKGTKSLTWQQQQSSNNRSSVVVVSDSGGDACYKCGKLGHWARDCTGGSGGGSDVAEKMCGCGLGACLVLTANTEKNRGRRFYRCPARQENGGCGFFEWCDNASTTPASNVAQYTVSNASQYTPPSSSFPDLPCPCGAGSCLILTARTEKNMGQQFYRCPASQDNSCGFFKWCKERSPSVGVQTNMSKSFTNMNHTSNKNYSEPRGSSCFKCGQDGHWAKDCQEASSASPVDFGGKSASSGTCYKCNMSGHWATDCLKPSSDSSVRVVGKSSPSSGSCYKCSKSGHWARDCPGQDRKAWR